LETWTTVFSNQVSLAAVGYGAAGFVAARANGSFLVSSNAVDWRNPHPDIGIPFLWDLTYLNGQFIGLNYEKWIFSSNGIAWTTTPAPTNTGNLFNLTFGKGLYVAGGESRSVWISTNLVDWTNPASNLTSFPYSADTRVAYGNGVFVGVASYEGSVLTSEDGLSWTLQQLSTNEFDYINFGDVTFGSGRFVAVGPNATATSTDGTNWITTRTNLFLSKVVSGGGKFVGVGSHTAIATSVDGIYWSAQDPGEFVPIVDVAYGAGWFVATAGLYYSGQNVIKQRQPYWISSNGMNWTKLRFNTAQGIAPIAFGDGTFVAGTHRGGILQSDPMVTLKLKAASPPELEISGPLHRQYQIEFCSTVASTNGWSSLAAITVTNETTLFTDWSGTNATCRFYRAFLLP